MSNRTKIAWADATWNPFSGCTPISEGCEHCYAERMAGRNLAATRCPECEGSGVELLGVGCDICDGTGNVGFEPTFHPQRLYTPLHWRKPRRVFVCSMSDMFHEAFVLAYRDWILEVAAKCPQHTFMILTKRVDEMSYYFDQDGHYAWGRINGVHPLSNVWLGVTAENQRRADERIPVLLDTPAAVRFVSLEPLLGPIDLGEYTDYTQDDEEAIWRAAEAEPVTLADRKRLFPKLDWAIVGGETGPGARPMQPEWALEVWRQCKAAGVPYFFKQSGAWLKREIEAGRYVPTAEYHEMESTQEFPRGSNDPEGEQ